MSIKQSITAALAALIVAALPASSFAATFKKGKAKPARTLQYYPDGRDIVCINGQNRYTRALYGTYSLFRLETSDRPVFATYDKQKSHNIRFTLTYSGQTVALDSTSYCEARYSGGRRCYVVSDKRWGDDALVRITALASRFEEGALWQFSATGFKGRVQINALLSDVKDWHFSRNGDLGTDRLEQFDAKPGAAKKRLTWDAQGETYFVLHHPADIEVLTDDSGKALMKKENDALAAVTSTMTFTTPDALINTLPANLLAAADGLWDGKTWLHGCIGWRTPLAGWRAAYLADAVGWNDRAVSHFDAYARSQVTDVPVSYPNPAQDSAKQLARAEKKWGTPMYSNGYICRYPDNNHTMHHYNMNLNYIDELLWHFQYNADKDYLRKMWPVLKLHLDWEKRNWDADGDHLYDAYCCIWASDALYYNSGGVTHSSAYNYRGNLLAARIAEIIGEDATPYRNEADAIIKAMNQQLWTGDHWAEFVDFMGLKRVHENAALWTVYTPVDCGIGTDEQNQMLADYMLTHFPRIPITFNIPDKYKGKYDINWSPYTISTTDWQPYEWSTNNVAHEEVASAVLALYAMGRNDEATRLLKSDLIDQMLLGRSPANFGQISYYDKARSEAYRDFGDNIGVMTRVIVNGLFGITPDALNGRCVIKPGWPAAWDEVEFHTPYIDMTFHRKDGKATFDIKQHFAQKLNIVVEYNNQTLESAADSHSFSFAAQEAAQPDYSNEAAWASPEAKTAEQIRQMGLVYPSKAAKSYRMVNIGKLFNSNVSDIFRNEYLSPRSPYTTLELPKTGIGQWCHPERMAEINDEGLRNTIKNDVWNATLDEGYAVPFCSPAAQKSNIIYTSLWDNYPDAATVPLKGNASGAWLMLAGSTNNMQSRIDNGIITVTYKDNSTDTLHLENPVNWCPIEQDYYVDDYAYHNTAERPYRFHLGSGIVSRQILTAMNSKLYGGNNHEMIYRGSDNIIPDGAGVLLCMPLDSSKKLKSLTLRTLSNDVVIGLMAVTLF